MLNGYEHAEQHSRVIEGVWLPSAVIEIKSLVFFAFRRRGIPPKSTKDRVFTAYVT